MKNNIITKYRMSLQNRTDINTYIMLRFLSQEDINSITDKTEQRSIIIKLSEIAKEYYPFKINISACQKELMKITEIKNKIKLKKKREDKLRVLEKALNHFKISEYIQIKIDYYKSYYPINCEGLSNSDITVNDYLRGEAFSGTRKTHGIHGFFIHEIDNSQPSYYEEYAYRQSKTKPKDIFIFFS